MSGWWHQHARDIFLPATSSCPVSLGGPAATFAFSTPDSGGHKTQCDIQPRVRAGVPLDLEQEGSAIRQAADGC